MRALRRWHAGDRCEVVRRRATHELEKAGARLHLVQGFLVAMADLDEVHFRTPCRRKEGCICSPAHELPLGRCFCLCPSAHPLPIRPAIFGGQPARYWVETASQPSIEIRY